MVVSLLLFFYGFNYVLVSILFLASIGYKRIINRNDIVCLIICYILAFSLFRLGIISEQFISTVYITILFLVLLNRTRNWLLATILASICYSTSTILWYITFRLLHVLFADVSLGGYPYLILPMPLFITTELALIAFYALFAWAVRTFDKKYRVIEIFMKSDRNYYTLSLFLLAAVGVTDIFHVFTFQHDLPIFFSLISFYSYVIILILAIFIGYFVIRTTNQTIYLHEKTAYAIQLEEENREVSYFKHDYRNILLTLSIFIKNNDMPGLRTYFFEELNQYSEETLANENILKDLQKLEILPLKGLLIEKSEQAKEFGVKIDISIPETIDTVQIPIIKLVRCVSILLDNAIEESKKQAESRVSIEVLHRQKEIIFKVQNSLAVAKQQPEAMMKDGYSTKGKGRGKGLASFERIINGLDNATYMMEQKDNTFTSYIFLTNK